jgi:tripartite-type tricarboxylate transporter receptor subunit TctC
MHRQGKIRILVAGSPRRLEGAPEIPISAEVGFADLITLQFMGVFAPGGTPRPVIDRIAAVTHEAMADKAFQQKLVAAGFEPVTDSGPEQTVKFVQEELVRWTPLLKASGIKFN